MTLHFHFPCIYVFQQRRRLWIYYRTFFFRTTIIKVHSISTKQLTKFKVHNGGKVLPFAAWDWFFSEKRLCSYLFTQGKLFLSAGVYHLFNTNFEPLALFCKPHSRTIIIQTVPKWRMQIGLQIILLWKEIQGVKNYNKTGWPD